MQFKGDGNQVMLLKQEIQNGRVQGVNEIDHLESVFQQKNKEMEAKYLQEKEMKDKAQKQSSIESKAALQNELKQLQQSLSHSQSQSVSYLEERESLEQKIQNFTRVKSEEEEQERQCVIEITQKESQWNLSLLKDQD